MTASAEHENKWFKKNVLVMGDSLTAANRWQIKLNTVLGMNVTTHAKGGLGMLDIINGDNAIPIRFRLSLLPMWLTKT